LTILSEKKGGKATSLTIPLGLGMERKGNEVRGVVVSFLGKGGIPKGLASGGGEILIR